ncbi:DedA family protein [Gemmatimonas sp.]|uniref:DedA family protein n=1 Tax=Gemmatimonas sp. TaxID=1962908 RepID=UPI003DA45481
MRLPVSLLLAEASWLSVLTDAPWTYIVLGASAIITEELAPIFGGIAVHEKELRLVPLIMAITLGGWLATALLYTVGRIKWEAIRRRFPRTRATGTVALRVVRRNPLTASFLVRFAFGLRIVLPMACGAARVPLFVFLPVSLIGSLAWTSAFTGLGYVAGEAAVQAIGHLGRAGEIVGALVVTVAVFAFLRWQRRRRERKAEKRALARHVSAVESNES